MNLIFSASNVLLKSSNFMDSYLIVKDQMNNAVIKCDLEKYKILFNEFVLNPDIVGHFEHDCESPATFNHFYNYPCCTCSNPPQMDIHNRHLGTVGCSCQNGKYYIALYYALHVLVSKYAREAELYTRYYTDSTILELEAELEKFIDADTIPIIQWIKKQNFVLQKDWVYNHIDYEMYYPKCRICVDVRNESLMG